MRRGKTDWSMYRSVGLYRRVGSAWLEKRKRVQVLLTQWKMEIERPVSNRSTQRQRCGCKALACRNVSGLHMHEREINEKRETNRNNPNPKKTDTKKQERQHCTKGAQWLGVNILLAWVPPKGKLRANTRLETPLSLLCNININLQMLHAMMKKLRQARARASSTHLSMLTFSL